MIEMFLDLLWKSSAIYENLQKFFGSFLKMFGKVCLAFGHFWGIFGNLQKVVGNLWKIAKKRHMNVLREFYVTKRKLCGYLEI